MIVVFGSTVAECRAQGQTFVAVTGDFPNLSQSGGAWGDYDGDGFLDLLITGRNPTLSGADLSLIYRNRGDGSFSNIYPSVLTSELPGERNASSVWADFDGDGDLDVLIAGEHDSRMYRNLGGNVFEAVPGAIPTGGQARAVAGDFDRDGDLDVIVASPSYSLYNNYDVWARLYRNHGGFAFDAGEDIGIEGFFNQTLSAADVDGDGDLDFLVSGSLKLTGAETLIFYNDGTGHFGGEWSGLPAVVSGTTAWGDYDNDGDTDLVIAGAGLNGKVAYLYRNDGGHVIYGNNPSEFTDSGVSLPQVSQPSVAWGDYDNDGYLDLAIAGVDTNSVRVAHILHNQGDGTFSESGITLPAVASGALLWGDVNNDGRLDLLVSGETGLDTRTTLLFSNQTAVANNPPTAPLALSATGLTEGAVLQWQAASDLNQASGLTYNVRIGTSSGANDIMPSMADGATGRRQIVASGNAGSRTTLALTNLQSRMYYWSVQAVDHAFAGGPFAPEVTFVVHGRPAISTLPDLVLSPGVSSAPLAFTVSDGDTAADALTVAVSASDEVLFPPSGLVLGGAGTDRTLTITPASGQAGSAVITLIVTDEDRDSASTTFTVDVQNQPPTISEVPAVQTVNYGDVPPPISFTIGDLETPPENLTIRVTSSNTDLIPDGGWVLGGTGADRTLTVAPVSGIVGTSQISITVLDEVGDGAEVNFLFEVYEEPPTLTGLSGELVLYPGQTSPDYVLTVSDDHTPASGISVIASSSDPGVIAPGELEVTGTDTTRTLRIHSSNASQGDVTITVTAKDEEGASTTVQLLVHLEAFTEIDLSGTFSGLVDCGGWVDCDGDGKLDLVLYGPGVPRVFRNLSSPEDGFAFEQGPAMPDTIGWYSAATDWADYDNDGDPDLLITGVWSIDPGFTLRIYRNDGDHFTIVDPGIQGVLNGWVSWNDFNGDGLPDFAIYGRSQDSLSFSAVYLNLGAQGFVLGSPQGSPETGPYVGYVMPELADWADLNNDGLVDFVGWGSSDNPLSHHGMRFLIHDGFFPKFPGTVFDPANVTIRNASVVDMNGDGFFDVRLSGYQNTSPTRAWSANGLGQGDGSFVFSVPHVRYQATAQAWGNADNDGIPDLVMTGEVFDDRNNTTRSFTGLLSGGVERPLSLAGTITQFSWGDVDGDGDLDIYCVKDSKPVLLRNNYPTPDVRPVAPVELTASSTNEVIRLTWSAGSDVNQTGGLSYNIAIRRQDGSPVILPDANLVTGVLKIPKRGNAGSMLYRELSNLPDGDYEWTVQTVDTSYEGSPFANWQTFSVAQPVTISEISDKVIRVNGSTGPVDFTVETGPSQSPDDLTISVISSNELLVPKSGMLISGGGRDRTITITPALDQIGDAEVIVQVSDGFAVVTESFKVTALADAPQLSMPSNVTIHMNGTSGLVPIQVSDTDYSVSALAFGTSSSREELFAASDVTISSDETNQSLLITPKAGEIGEATLNLVVSNPAGLSVTNQMIVTVVDDPPVTTSAELATDEDVSLLITLDAVDPEQQPLSVTIASPPSNGILSGEGLSRTYTPATNYFGPDSFSFLVNDGRQNSDLATIAIVVNSVPDTTSGSLVAQPLSNGQFLLHLQAEPLTSYRIDVSTDLKIWTGWLTLRADENGDLSQLDAVPRQQRFYRIMPLN